MSPCACKFDYCFSSAILFDNFTGMSNKEPREVTFASLCCLLCLWCELSTFFCSTIDGYSMPLVCRGGLMYLSLLGKPSDKDLERYPAVHLTGPHEWNPSVLDFCYPSADGEPPCSNDPTERFTFDPSFDEFVDYTHRAIQTLNILDDSSQLMTPYPTIRANQHLFRTNKHVVTNDSC